MPDTHSTELVHSYTRVRFALGMLGLLMPVVLILGGIFDDLRPDATLKSGIEPTISDFYHTTYRDVFVGSLCAIGVFLISYRGYRREPNEIIDDDWLATIAGLAAFVVAFFPNGAGGDRASMMQVHFGSAAAETLHYAAAFVFFSSLAAFCFFKFAKTDRQGRRWIYQACGTVIIGALILTMVAVYFRKLTDGAGKVFVEDNNLIFWFEAVGIWAFALSWLVKSKADMILAERLMRRKTTD